MWGHHMPVLGAIGLALEPLAWQISQPGGGSVATVKEATQTHSPPEPSNKTNHAASCKHGDDDLRFPLLPKLTKVPRLL